MGFMKLYTDSGLWVVVETSNGTEIVPFLLAGANPTLESLAEYCEGTPESFEVKEGFCARFSAPGYMDCTGWCGPYATEAEAVRECREIYGDDDDDGVSEDRSI